MYIMSVVGVETHYILNKFPGTDYALRSYQEKLKIYGNVLKFSKKKKKSIDTLLGMILTQNQFQEEKNIIIVPIDL